MFLQLMEEAEKSDKAFLQGAQQELSEEMATLQKKILMDTVRFRINFCQVWLAVVVMITARITAALIEYM